MLSAKQRVNRIIQQLYKNRIFRMGEVVYSSTNIAFEQREWLSSSYNIYFTKDNIDRIESTFYPFHGRFVFILSEYLAEHDSYRTNYVKSLYDIPFFKIDSILHSNRESPHVYTRNYCSWENNYISESYTIGRDETYEQFIINILFLNYLFFNKRYNDMRMFIQTVEAGKNLDSKHAIETAGVCNDVKNQTSILKQMRHSKVIILQSGDSGGGVG